MHRNDEGDPAGDVVAPLVAGDEQQDRRANERHEGDQCQDVIEEVHQNEPSRDDHPGEQHRDADQHDEGVSVEVSRLQLHDAAGDVLHAMAEALDDGLVDQPVVKALPQRVAEPEGGPDEDDVVELVEVPFVEEEQIEPAIGRGEARGRGLVDHVHVPGDAKADEHRDGRGPGDDGRHRVGCFVARGDDAERALEEAAHHFGVGEEVWSEDDARHHRSGREDVERHEHDVRALMRLMVGVIVVAVVVVMRRAGAGVENITRLAVESQVDEAPGVKGGEGRGDGQGPEAEGAEIAADAVGAFDDRVLGEEAGKAERRAGNADAGQRQRADHHDGVGDRDFPREPAHVPHVLLVVHRVDHRAGAEEQQGLEEGVGEEMEDARRIDPCPERDEHVAELRAGRVGDDALDVVLDQPDRRRKEGGDRADREDESHRDRRGIEHRRQPRHHEHAGGDHGRGMDERGDRGRAFHRVG